jgi:hypothetical protein
MALSDELDAIEADVGDKPAPPEPEAPAADKPTALPDWKAAKKSARLAIKREQELRFARLDATQRELDAELLQVEQAGDELLDWDHAQALDGMTGEQALAEIERRNAERRVAYVESMRDRLRDRTSVAWAAARVLEVRQREKETRNVQRALVKSAARKTERREAFFYDEILRWARSAPRDTPKGIRLPEANLRLELYPIPAGARLVDEAQATEAMAHHLRAEAYVAAVEAEMRLLFAGVLRLELRLDKERALALVERDGLALPGTTLEDGQTKVKIVPLAGTRR